MLRRRLLAALLATASPSVFAATYMLDPNHTQVQFVWHHYGFTNLVGQFGKIEGTLEFDANDPTKSSVTAKIEVASVNSNVKKLDERLVSTDYFDAAKYPVATFKSSKVERGATPDRLKVIGDLTLHGVTRPVTLEVTVTKVGEQPLRKAPAAGFDATTTLNRSDFGIKTYLPMVADEVKIHVVAEAVEASGFAAGHKPPAK